MWEEPLPIYIILTFAWDPTVGISGTVPDLFAPSRIPDSFSYALAIIIVPEVEERRAIKPLVAQMLA